MYTKVFETYAAAKSGMAWLMLAVLVMLAGGAEAASLSECAGGIRMTAPGTVECAAGGGATSCTEGFIIDSQGAIRCGAVDTLPVCTLTQMAMGSGVILTATCTPTANSYVWSSNTGFSSTAASGMISQPSATTTYTVAGVNAAGTGDTASITVTGSQSSTSKPSCTLTQMAQGSGISLSVSCTPAATSYVWSSNTGFASSATGGLISTPTVNTTYTVAGVNAAGTGSTASTTVIGSQSGSTPNCTLSQMAFGGKISLSASCSPAATSYAWSSNTGFTSTTSNGLIDPPTVTTTYTVTGTNAAGTGNTASTTYTVTIQVPTCTLTANPTAVDANGTSTLTAACTGSPTSYAWVGGTCAGTIASTCTVTPSATTTYTVTGSNAAGAGNASATVTVSAPVCTVTASPSSIAPTETSTLTVSCSPAATSYAWSDDTTSSCDAVTISTCTTGALNATTTYTVIGTNTVGAGAPASATVSVVAPVCTLTASPSSVGRGQSSTLTASCTPAVSGNYTWTGADCSAVTTATCTVTPLVAGTETYTVKGDNAAGTSNEASATVTAAAPSCTLAASPTSVSAGGSSTLTASCSPTPTSYTWTGGTCAGTTASTCTVSPSATTSYTVTGNDTVGAGNTASATVTLTAASCSASAVTWGPGLAAYGGNGGTPVLTNDPGVMQAFSLTQAERLPRAITIAYGQCRFEFSISPSPCDFDPGLIAQSCYAAGIDPSIIAQTSDQPAAAGRCVLQVNQPYYLNVRQPAGYETPNCTYYLAW